MPTPHCRHTDDVVARTTTLNVPAAHAAQSVSATPPVIDLYLPAAHAGHPLPVAFLYLPVGQ